MRHANRPLTTALVLGLLAPGLPAVFGPAPALAQAPEGRSCVARINDSPIVIDDASLGDAAPKPSARDRLLGWPGRTWDRALGNPVECDSARILAYLSRSIPEDEVDGYCLAEGAEGSGWLLVPGERNRRGHCRTTTCEKVNMAKEEALSATASLARTITGTGGSGSGGADSGSGTGAAGADTPAEDAARDDIRSHGILHSSGAAIVTGAAGAMSSSLTSTLSSAGAAMVPVLTAPATLAAAAVSVVAVGGAVYVCSGS